MIRYEMGGMGSTWPMLARFLLLSIFLVSFFGCSEKDKTNPSVFFLEEPPQINLYLPIISTEVSANQGVAKAYGSLKSGEAERLGITWYYDYALRWPGSRLDNGAGYTPYFWCDHYPSLSFPPLTDYFVELEKLPKGYSGPLLFLNEPDLAGGDVDGLQCDRTPRQAAYIYKAVLRICPNCRIIGPSVSHEDYLNGWPWLREFYSEIYRLQLRPPDVAGLHDYTDHPPAMVVNSLFDTLKDFPGSTDKVWITEFSSCDSNRTKEAIEFYKSDYRVERWAWFTATGYPASPCYNLIELSTRELTPNGRVFSSGYP